MVAEAYEEVEVVEVVNLTKVAEVVTLRSSYLLLVEILRRSWNLHPRD